MWQKLKAWVVSDAVFYTVLLLLVGVGSFGLGRASVVESPKVSPVSGVRIVPAPSASSGLPVGADQMVVASRAGTKYHLPDCPGAQQISATNRIEFASVAAAQAAGYEPAANCPGL